MITLESGERVLLRPLSSDDGEDLVELFSHASDEDVLFFRHEVRDAELVASWAEDVDLNRIFALVAVADERIVGDATLHLGEGYNRHIGWVRIYLDQTFRNKGIGTEMIKALIEIGRRLSLHQIVAEIVSHQVQAIKAFESLNFQREYRHENYYLFGDNELFDLVVYVLRLGPPPGRF
jgi:RimJ/RimL family protein N-acetyltransferase